MKGLRLLNNGEWSKPVILTAARRIIVRGLARHYPLCALGEAASFLNGTSYDVTQLSEAGPYPIIRISNITDPSSSFIRTREDLGSKFWVRQGDLLVSWSASFKSTLWSGTEGYLNQHIFKVEEKGSFNRGFIRHAIEASFEEMQENLVGIGMMHLRRSDFLGYKIPAPPISVQNTVATYLDWIEKGANGQAPPLPPELTKQRRALGWIEDLAGKVHEARTLRQLAAEEANALIVSARRSVFGAAPSEDWIPVSSFVSMIENGKSPQCESRPANADEWGVLKVGAISFGTFDERQNKALPQGLEFDPSYEVRSGDFLMSRANTTDLVGACAIVNGTRRRLLLSDKTFRFHFRKDRKILPMWLDHAMKSPALRDQIERGASGTSPTMKNISKEKVFGLLLPPHDLARQHRVVSHLDGLQKTTDALKDLQTETSSGLDALMPSILDKAFRGEL